MKMNIHDRTFSGRLLYYFHFGSSPILHPFFKEELIINRQSLNKLFNFGTKI